ncbi:hypothetical protein [Moraxella nasicaprae]|uniref:Uncharacterized protein n=1 Tax=Moraxella nasicaprae TaxID=2904122 RepID=A0ABY6F5Q5_9GAMM|nr:hypothetical protein [Moraxella nasicaprae]UXZ05378.1 hypothetical protein LU297_02715 [Moraxella nasicaprae]
MLENQIIIVEFWLDSVRLSLCVYDNLAVVNESVLAIHQVEPVPNAENVMPKRAVYAQFVHLNPNAANYNHHIAYNMYKTVEHDCVIVPQ